MSTDIDYSANGRASDLDAAVNRFEDYSTAGITFLSRTDGFANYATATAAPTDFSMPDEDRAYLDAHSVAKTATMGSDNGGLDNMTMMFIGIDVGVAVVLIAAEVLVVLNWRKQHKKNGRISDLWCFPRRRRGKHPENAGCLLEQNVEPRRQLTARFNVLFNVLSRFEMAIWDTPNRLPISSMESLRTYGF